MPTLEFINILEHTLRNNTRHPSLPLPSACHPDPPQHPNSGFSLVPDYVINTNFSALRSPNALEIWYFRECSGFDNSLAITLVGDPPSSK
jgi:hypothetical protein